MPLAGDRSYHEAPSKEDSLARAFLAVTRVIPMHVTSSVAVQTAKPSSAHCDGVIGRMLLHSAWAQLALTFEKHDTQRNREIEALSLAR